MRLEQLQYFTETVNCKSINKAASKLFISQSTLSEALNKLEDEFGVTMLQRTHMGVVPTHEGKDFYAMAVNIVDQIEAYKKTLANNKNNGFMKDMLTYFVTPELMNSVVPDFMSYMAKYNPKIKLACKTGDFLDGFYSVINISTAI